MRPGKRGTRGIPPRVDFPLTGGRSHRNKPLEQGPGGPILVILSEANHFNTYYSEILRAEGLNEFAAVDISQVTAELLSRYDVVILGEMPLTPAQASTVSNWLRGGGNLIALRPEKGLAQLLGLRRSGEVLSDTYLALNTETGPAKGLVAETIQFHGSADLYLPAEGKVLATLYRSEATPTESPAILLKTVGDGQAAIFAYDLARSIVYTRQGNPAWSGVERDGIPPIRSDDLFYGASDSNPAPDWVNLDKVAIPQADEQQRLLANLILQMNAARKPLPRFWYFPRSLKAVIIMTGDDHGHGGTVGRFERFREASPANCSLADWECLRSTSNIFLGSITPEEADKAHREGFEVGLHIYTGCEDWATRKIQETDGPTANKVSWESTNLLYSHQLNAFAALYPGLPHPVTSRTDCITWGDFDTQPRAEFEHGIRLDTNFYYWPPKWVRNRPGMFTGSGIPMRFATIDGRLIDVYQATTQMTDESGQTYPYTIDTLLANATGAQQYVGAFTVNMHTDEAISAGADAIVIAAKAKGIPVVSAQQMLDWLDARNESSFAEIRWTASELRFSIEPDDRARGLGALLPIASKNAVLMTLTVDGSPVTFKHTTFAGVEYAEFPAQPGKYVAHYAAR